MKMKTLEDVFQDELFDVYDAEQRLIKALPEMAKQATDPKLAEALRSHLRETEGQLQRLEQVFKILGVKAQKEKCEAMKGLIEEAEQLMKHTAEGAVRDAAMISAAQKVEHYEIASYGTLVALATTLGHTEAADILHETLKEEKNADSMLSMLAEDHVNDNAMRQAA
jgi:ferritin-like metal-binding protein YciE